MARPYWSPGSASGAGSRATVFEQLAELESTEQQWNEIDWLIFRLRPNAGQLGFLIASVCGGPVTGPLDLSKDQADHWLTSCGITPTAEHASQVDRGEPDLWKQEILRTSWMIPLPPPWSPP